MSLSFQNLASSAAAAFVICAGASAQAATFVGPVPYLSEADIPAGFYAGGAPTFLENFEDGTLDGGITASAGTPYGPSGITDSVDGDDGAIDGFGTRGWSFFSGSGARGITFTFETAVTAAAVVWTDGAGTTSFEAFDADSLSLGTIGPVAIADGSFSGTTGDDHFFGVTHLGGIEVDHVQYGDAFVDGAVPVPASLPLLAGALGLGAALRRRQRS